MLYLFIDSNQGRHPDNMKVSLQSKEGQKLVLQGNLSTLDSKIYVAQTENLRSQEDKGAETGLAMKNSRGQRDNSLQPAGVEGRW